MNDGKFHTKIAKIIKDGITRWTWETNPLEWEGIPSAAADLVFEVVKGGRLIANTENKLAFISFPGSDNEIEVEFDIAEYILKFNKYYRSCDKACAVKDAITLLESAITTLKNEAKARKWDIS